MAIGEGVEELAQAFQIGEFVEPHEIRLPGDQQVFLELGGIDHQAGHVERLLHQAIHVLPRLLHLLDQSVADLLDVMAAKGLSIFKTLADNNAYNALSACGGLIVTGPTGTNVNDAAVALIRAQK